MEDPIACVHADRCGGCPAIHLPYDEQLALKRGRVVQALARYPSLELVYADPVLAAESVTQYRTRAKLIVGPRGAVGLFAKGGGHDVVDVPQCRVLSPVVGRVVSGVRKHEATTAIAGLRAIDVRELDDGVAPRALLTLVVNRNGASDVVALRTVAHGLLAEIPELVGVAANLHDGDSPQVLGNETVLLAGTASATDRVGECVHVATFGSFVQAHRVQAARVHDLVATSLGIGKSTSRSLQGRDGPARRPRVLDLYAGSGAIALALARRGADVTCVEAFGPAALRIEEAAAHNDLHIRAIHSDVASALRALEDQGSWDAIVVNPPRRGVGPVARVGLARMRAPVIAYVSCDPDTLTRDLDHLARLGYRCASAQPLDMIPLSDEVETVAVLRRAPPSAVRVLYEDDRLLFVEKAPHEPTMPSREHEGSLTSRVQRLPNAEAAVPVTKLDVGTSGVVLFARTPGDAVALDRAANAASARKVYLAGTRGVIPTKGSIARALSSSGTNDDDATSSTARTKYRRLGIFAGHCVARAMPDRGRGHQIRRHFASIGHPVLGDDRHGHASTNRHFEEKYGLESNVPPLRAHGARSPIHRRAARRRIRASGRSRERPRSSGRPRHPAAARAEERPRPRDVERSPSSERPGVPRITKHLRWSPRPCRHRLGGRRSARLTTKYSRKRVTGRHEDAKELGRNNNQTFVSSRLPVRLSD